MGRGGGNAAGAGAAGGVGRGYGENTTFVPVQDDERGVARDLEDVGRPQDAQKQNQGHFQNVLILHQVDL